MGVGRMGIAMVFERFGAEWDITLWFISKDGKISSGQV